nr:MAG TPA: hypothetical protein [Caudoviricetes sp.]
MESRRKAAFLLSIKFFLVFSFIVRKRRRGRRLKIVRMERALSGRSPCFPVIVTETGAFFSWTTNGSR